MKNTKTGIDQRCARCGCSAYYAYCCKQCEELHYVEKERDEWKARAENAEYELAKYDPAKLLEHCQGSIVDTLKAIIAKQQDEKMKALAERNAARTERDEWKVRAEKAEKERDEWKAKYVKSESCLLEAQKLIHVGCVVCGGGLLHAYERGVCDGCGEVYEGRCCSLSRPSTV